MQEGWISPGVFVPEFEEVMNQLQPGQLSDPLVSRFGVHLIEVLGRRESDHEDLVQMAFEQLILTLSRQSYAQACSLKTWASTVSAKALAEPSRPTTTIQKMAPGPPA